MSTLEKKKKAIRGDNAWLSGYIKKRKVQTNNADSSINSDYVAHLVHFHGFTSEKATELVNEIRRSGRQNKVDSERSKQ